MFYPYNDLPCQDCREAAFHAVDANRSAGYIECDAARIAVRFEMLPQPNLTFFPPLRLIDDADATVSFLDACLEEGDERWFDFEVQPSSGQVSWRRDLVTGDADEADAALREAREFFDECWPWLEDTVARCGAVPKRPGLFQRFIDFIMEV